MKYQCSYTRKKFYYININDNDSYCTMQFEITIFDTITNKYIAKNLLHMIRIVNFNSLVYLPTNYVLSPHNNQNTSLKLCNKAKNYSFTVQYGLQILRKEYKNFYGL